MIAVAAVAAVICLRRFLAFRAAAPLIPLLLAVGFALVAAYAGHGLLVPIVSDVMHTAQTNAVSHDLPTAVEAKGATRDGSWVDKARTFERDLVGFLQSPTDSPRLIAFILTFVFTLPVFVVLIAWTFRKLGRPATCGVLLLLFSIGETSALADQARTPVTSYYLLIDVSASMNEIPKPPVTPVEWKSSKLAEVKRQLAELCENLPTEGALRVFVFDEGLPREGPRFDLVGDNQRAALRAYFSSLRAEGHRTYAWRSLDNILSLAANELASSNRTSAIRIVTYTDGEDNDPSRPQLEDILAKHRHLLRDNKGAVQVSYLTLGFALSVETESLFASYGVQALPSLRPEDVAPLIPDFSWRPERPEVGDDVQFIDNSAGMISGYSWDFGDARSSEKSPEHRFATHGSHQIRLTVKSPSGRSQAVEKTVVVAPPPAVSPVFSIFPAEIRAGDSVGFRNQTTGPAAEFAWEFGDGKESTNREPAHSYTKPGSYSVTLTARGFKGQSASITNQIQVIPFPAPVAAFVFGSQRVVAGEPVQLINRSSGVIQQVEWTFSDTPQSQVLAISPGNPPESNFVTHTFKAPGEQSVRLEVSGPGGRREVAERIQVVAPVRHLVPPVARFVVDCAKGTAPLVVRFRNRSEGDAQRFELDFGDGSPRFIATNCVDCTHAYQVPGSYTPVLKAQGDAPSLQSTFFMPGHAIVVKPPPSWLARNWWLIGLVLVAVVGAAAGAQPCLARRSWAARHGHLNGFIHWKPVEPKTTPWKSVKIIAGNGEFTHAIASEELHGAAPLFLKLQKRVDARKRREIYTVDVSRNENVLATAVLEPGTEKPLTVPGIVIRYDS